MSMRSTIRKATCGSIFTKTSCTLTTPASRATRGSTTHRHRSFDARSDLYQSCLSAVSLSPTLPDAGALVPLSHQPLVNEREQARQIKVAEPVIVCIGNPPYDRQMDEGAARKGGWVRFGDQRQEVPILEDFLEPARRAGEG